MAAARVPTAASRSCVDANSVSAALDEFGPPYVVKDDGLAGGKGVVVTHDRAELSLMPNGVSSPITGWSLRSTLTARR
ncbi:phosphoribosylamine-glycine ligase [Cutibacterium acnes JCM 18918]|nr:phosphoribosylamine-glycine ligase [Cutibacterium acnes JCM 18918]